MPSKRPAAASTPSTPRTPSTPSQSSSTTHSTTTSSLSKPSSSKQQQQSQSAQEILAKTWDNYWRKTAQRTKLTDAFMAFLVVVGAVQFLYCLVVGNYVSIFFFWGFFWLALGLEGVVGGERIGKWMGGGPGGCRFNRVKRGILPTNRHPFLLSSSQQQSSTNADPNPHSQPFNAFLSGFSATVGQFVLTASLRIQTNPENKNEFKSVSHERYVPFHSISSPWL